MAGRTLTIEFPGTAHLPAELQRDQQYLRYLVAGTLYTRGQVSGREARELTGDSRRAFEENMARYGFPLMPDDPDSVAQELDAKL
jgi:predicted HTH domain antitoxin